MSVEYQSQQIQELFDISRETVRQWAKAFSDFLSPGASPGGSRHRVYTEDDLKVFSLVNDLRKRGMRTDDIVAALTNGQRGDMPEGIEKGVTLYQSRVALRDSYGKIEDLENTIQQLREENIRLQTLLEASTDTKADDLERAYRRIEELSEEIGALKYQLKQVSKPDK